MTRLHLKGLNLIFGDNSTRALLFNYRSRGEMLVRRRKKLLERYSTWRDLLAKTPRVKSALVAFYGLESDAPLFDYRKTAEVTGLSIQSVRVYVPQGVRLLFYKQEPSLSSVHDLENQRIYQYWRNHRGNIQLSEESSRVLDLYYGESLSHRQIARMMGVSEETVRRKRLYALKLIGVVWDKECEQVLEYKTMNGMESEK